MKKILIVEDDKDIARALSMRLANSSYEVHLAHDVPQGVSMAVNTVPDLIMLDISMPGGNGFIFAERVHSLPKTLSIPIIFMTANKDPEFKDRAESLGAAAYLEKPFDTDEVLNTIEELLIDH